VELRQKLDMMDAAVQVHAPIRNERRTVEEPIAQECLLLLDSIDRSGSADKIVQLKDLGERARQPEVLAICAQRGWIEFLRRKHCHVGSVLRLENGYEVMRVIGSDRRPMGEILADDEARFDPEVRLRVRLTADGYAAMSAERLRMDWYTLDDVTNRRSHAWQFLPALRSPIVEKCQAMAAAAASAGIAKWTDDPEATGEAVRRWLVGRGMTDANAGQMPVAEVTRLLQNTKRDAEARLVPGSKEYDVALSFAGENRQYVEDVAEGLRALSIKVFYDDFEKAELWGKNLYEHLVDVYRRRARFTVIFVSKHYAAKIWPNHERQAAQSRAIEENREYILPARFDDTELPGLLPTTHFIDLRKHPPQEVCSLICEKIGRNPLRSKAYDVPSPRAQSPTGTVTFNYSSYNGRYRIGANAYEFETQWSKAGDRAIYCLADMPSIRGVALAPRGVGLNAITDAAVLDFTSRVRTVEEGQIAILQNTNGFFAAIEVLDVRDSTHRDDRDQLTFRYWILTDGGRDFSQVAPFNGATVANRL
jgi:hypothetical protein